MEFNIKGEIGEWGLAVCKVIVVNPDNDKNYISVNAAIDTGAYDCHIKKSVVDFLRLPLIAEGRVAHPVIGTRSVGIYNTDFVFESNIRIESVESKILLMEDYPAEVIIGTSFLKGKSFNYNALLGLWRIVW